MAVSVRLLPTTTPVALSAITLPAPETVPPIELPDAELNTSTPSPLLPRLVAPAELVPIQFPSTTLPVVPEDEMVTPLPVATAIVLATAAVVPHIVLAVGS